MKSKALKKKSPARASAPAAKKMAGVITMPTTLKKGEAWAGVLLDKSGNAFAHLIELPGKVKSATWDEAMKWAKEQGGELPDEQEGALLYANRKHAFDPEWHWLRTQDASYSVYAWIQSFSAGDQNSSNKDYRYVARAVRSIPI